MWICEKQKMNPLIDLKNLEFWIKYINILIDISKIV